MSHWQIAFVAPTVHLTTIGSQMVTHGDKSSNGIRGLCNILVGVAFNYHLQTAISPTVKYVAMIPKIHHSTSLEVQFCQNQDCNQHVIWHLYHPHVTILRWLQGFQNPSTDFHSNQPYQSPVSWPVSTWTHGMLISFWKVVTSGCSNSLVTLSLMLPAFCNTQAKEAY